MATGNGRCNITNRYITQKNYHGDSQSFIREVLKRFNTLDAKRLFFEIGLLLTEGKNGRLYPLSLQSSTVVDLLLFESKRVGVKINLLSEVEKIQKDGSIFKLFYSGKSGIYDTILIATGSNALPSLGSSDSGYRFAKELSHNLSKPFASLVQLVCKDSLLQEAAGVKVEASLKLSVDGVVKKSICGDLLFTKYGLSGSAILDISRGASLGILENKEVKIEIGLLPDLSLDELKSIMVKNSKLLTKMPKELWLRGFINKKLINLVLDRANLKKRDKLSRKDINKIAYTLKNIQVDIVDTRGENGCEVMAGGVLTKDIDPKSMESKIVDGLFFSGEVLDVDGDCGGYNLHFAWASGYLAGKSI